MALDTGGDPKLQTVNPNQYSIRAEKDLEKSNVNWSKVASDFTKVVDKVRDDRQARKKELDDATTTAMNNLNEITPVDNQTLGTMVLNTSNASKEALQIQNDLMKQGKLKPNDYMKFQQRLSDQWASWNNSVKNWDASYKTAMERVQNGTASGQEIFINELTQSFGNVNGLQMYVNPETGDMSLVRMNEDGSMPDPKKNPDAYMSMNYINQRMNQQVDAVDVSKEVAPAVDRFANVIRMEINSANGAYTSYEDFRQMDDFDKMINDQVNAFTTDPNQVASILNDNVGGYSFTTNPNEAKNDPKKILLQNNSNGHLIPQITDEQLTEAQRYTRTAMESQLDSKMDYDKGARFAPKSKTAAEISAGRQDELAQSYLNSIDMLITGTAEDADAGGQNLVDEVNKNLAKDAPQVKEITRTEDGNFVIETEQKTITVDSEGKTPEQIRREIYSAVTPAGTVTYDAIKEGDLTGNIGEGTGGGTIGVEKINWSPNPTVGKGTNAKRITIDDWFAVVDPALGERLSSGLDDEQQVQTEFMSLMNTAGFLPKQIKDSGNYDIKLDGGRFTIVVGGSNKTLPGDIYSYDTKDVIKQMQNVIQQEVNRLNKGGQSGGELD
jgi:hypothetical protein